MFLAFEGIDHSGKSTQIELLTNYITINQPYKNIIKTRQPDYEIRKIFLKKQFFELSESFLLLADMFNTIEKFIKPNINLKNTIIIADRYLYSFIAYQLLIYDNRYSYNRFKNNFLNNLNTYEIPIPDKIFYLKTSLEDSRERSKFKNNLDNIEKLPDEYFKRVINNFDNIFENKIPELYSWGLQNAYIIETKNKSSEEIFNENLNRYLL